MSNSVLPKKYTRYLALGAEIAVSIAIPVCGGYFADSYFNTFPWLTLAGSLLGMATFIFTIIRISKKLDAEGND